MKRWSSLYFLALLCVPWLAHAEVDARILEQLKQQFNDSLAQAQSTENSEDQRRWALKALSRGAALERYTKKHHYTATDTTLAEALLELAELALSNKEYDLAFNYAAQAKQYRDKSGATGNDILVQATFVERVAKRNKAYKKLVKNQLALDFSTVLDLSKNTYGEDSVKHFRLREKVALNIFSLVPRADKPWLDSSQYTAPALLRAYHQHYAVFHRLKYYAHAAEILQAIYRQHLSDAKTYVFKQPDAVHYYLGQYKLVQGAFNVGAELLQQVAQHSQNKRLQHASRFYLFQLYQAAGHTALADHYWERLGLAERPSAGGLIYYHDYELPDELYQKNKNIRWRFEVDINPRGYVDSIRAPDVTHQTVEKKSLEQWVRSFRFTPHAVNGQPATRTSIIEFSLTLERYKKNQAFRDETTLQGYMYAVAAHYFPGLLTKVKTTAVTAVIQPKLSQHSH